MSGACSTRGKDECLQQFSRQIRRKGPLGRSRRRRKNNIKMGLKIVCEDVDWIHLPHNIVMNLHFQ
jgi:hypothetical protein